MPGEKLAGKQKAEADQLEILPQIFETLNAFAVVVQPPSYPCLIAGFRSGKILGRMANLLGGVQIKQMSQVL